MPRKLKTYVTTSGFFDLAVAAPSMKAALEIWGSTSNLFQKGFANETSDTDVVKATLEHPGIILRRPVGSKGLFKENAELPELSVLQNAIKHKRPAEPLKKKAVKAKPKPAKPDSAATRKAARLYDLAEKRRERDDAREVAQRAKERDRRDQAVEKAQAALDEARARHDAHAAEIEKQREALDRKARLEGERWDEEEDKLKAALRRARDD
jgi:colicin import membrane protein